MGQVSVAMRFLKERLVAGEMRMALLSHGRLFHTGDGDMQERFVILMRGPMACEVLEFISALFTWANFPQAFNGNPQYHFHVQRPCYMFIARCVNTMDANTYIGLLRLHV